VFEKSKTKRPLVRPKYRWNDNNNNNNKIDIREVDICFGTGRSGGCCEQNNEPYNEGRSFDEMGNLVSQKKILLHGVRSLL
jgi:hypothetical protein